jgi:hypothetical protein
MPFARRIQNPEGLYFVTFAIVQWRGRPLEDSAQRPNTTPNGGNFDPHFNARKLTALVGIAPYESQSGTSVNAGTHVSKFGHLDVNALLHTAAMSSIECNERNKEYYKRKKQEGKPGFLVLNNIKNKIVHHDICCLQVAGSL